MQIAVGFLHVCADKLETELLANMGVVILKRLTQCRMLRQHDKLSKQLIAAKLVEQVSRTITIDVLT